MIGMLTGQVIEERDGRLVLNVGGVGYEVNVPSHQLKALESRVLDAEDPKARLTTLETPVTLYIHHHATERNPLPQLFGFNDLNERRFFELLLTVSGMGPVAAAKTMTISVPEYASRIMTRDYKALAQLPGIGTAKAEQIVAKLRSKMALFALMQEDKIKERRPAAEEFVQMALIALEDLGYKPAEAEHLVEEARKANPKTMTVEDLLSEVWALNKDRR